jgi:hypothetical protein
MKVMIEKSKTQKWKKHSVSIRQENQEYNIVMMLESSLTFQCCEVCTSHTD